MKIQEGQEISLASYEREHLRLIEISPDFFHSLCENDRFAEILDDLDVARADQLHLFETLDVDGNGTLDLEELIVGIEKLRGDPRRADIISVNLMLRSLQNTFLEHAVHVDNKFTRMSSEIQCASPVVSIRSPEGSKENHLPPGIKKATSGRSRSLNALRDLSESQLC